MPMRRRISTGSVTGAVDFHLADFDQPFGAGLRNGLVHAVQAAHECALAAAGRPNDRGDVVGWHRHVDGLQRQVLAVPGIQSANFDSYTHTG